MLQGEMMGRVTFDPSAPVLGLVIRPGDDAAFLRPIVASSDGISMILGGDLEVVEIDGGSVLWLDESGKNRRSPTNLLATKIAHRLNAGLFPDDTINGTALIVGEVEGPTGDLVACDVTAETLRRIRSVGAIVRPG